MASAGTTVVRIGVDSSLVDALEGTVAVLVVGATEAGLEDEPQAATQTVRATMAKVALAWSTPSARFLQQGTVWAMPTVWTSRTVAAVMFGAGRLGSALDGYRRARAVFGGAERTRGDYDCCTTFEAEPDEQVGHQGLGPNGATCDSRR